MSKIKIGLLGLGNVGAGMWEILHKNQQSISDNLGSKLEIKKVLVRDLNKKRLVEIPEGILTTNAEDVINNPDIDIVVEVLGGINPAYEYMQESINNGKHVVTANKAVIATYGDKLLSMARDKNVEIRYEGSVGGGIPIIATLTHSLSANRIEEIVGIINGTTNYILTRMSKNGLDFNTALKEAQDSGYAEMDPTSDIDGEDAAFKLCILASIGFGVQVAPKDIPREGITRISEREIQYAEQLGYTVKLLAIARREKDTLELHVHPALVSGNHPLASVNNEFNALFIRGNAVGEVMLYGRGAGSLPTGSAVLSDVMEIAGIINSQSTPNKKIYKNSLSIKVNGEGTGEYYIRLQVVDRPGVLGKIASTFGDYGVSLASVVQQGKGEEETVPLVFITHTVERINLNTALDKIRTFNEVEEVASILRVEHF